MPEQATNVLINGKSVITASLDVDQEQIDITSEWERDPDWTFVDESDHIHAYAKDGELRVESISPQGIATGSIAGRGELGQR